MEFVSPLTGKKCNQIIQKIPSKEIVKIYKSKKNVNLESEFQNEFVYLIEEPEVGFEFFVPFKSGSLKFYQDFYKDSKYQQTKEEYSFASKFILPEQNVLDVGCGAGVFARFIPLAHFTGLEFNPESIKKAEKNSVKVHQLSAKDYYEKFSHKFDVVSSFQVIEHVENPAEFIEDCLRLVNDEGYLILSVPNNDGFKYLEVNSFSNIPPHHISRWSLRTFLYISRRFNLEIIDYYYDKGSIKNYLRFGLINRLIGKNRVILKFNLIVRALDLILNVIFYLFHPKIFASPPSVAGHSLTVVFKKR
jgi:2-polyprenyl-3-methyl-5-hydroxy-6-metoxy-1,4-benzoquinol methylase